MAQVEGLFASLTRLLDKQNQLVSQLVSLAEQELLALQGNNLEGLQAITSAQAQASRELSRLEEERMQVQEELSRLFKLGDNQVTLMEVLPYAPEEAHAQLQSLTASLSHNFGRIKELNLLNRILIRHCLAYIKYMRSTIWPQPDVVYEASGEVSCPQDHLRLDAQA
ncbi:MAG: flagellar protein FlgN [Clostridia bacterium]|nr:MAG: flagellar protein FlgN [Clostridia bacterium]